MISLSSNWDLKDLGRRYTYILSRSFQLIYNSIFHEFFFPHISNKLPLDGVSDSPGTRLLRLFLLLLHIPFYAIQWSKLNLKMAFESSVFVSNEICIFTFIVF